MGITLSGLRIILFSLLLLFAGVNQTVYAQKKFNAAKALKKADKHLKNGEFYEAIELYQKVLAEESDHKAMFNLAHSYFGVRDYKNAQRTYKRLYDQDDPDYPLAEFYNGLSLKMLGKYDASKGVFMSFKKAYRGLDAAEFKKRIKLEIDGCNLAVKSQKSPLDVVISNLGPNVNNPYMDFSPAPMGDSVLVFAALRSDTLITKMKGDTNTYFVKMYKSYKQGGSYSRAVEMSMPFRSDEMHIANGTFSSDYKKFYFTMCEDAANNRVICAIYMSELKADGTWGFPLRLSDQINDDKFTSTQPSIGISDKFGEVLYFVSDRPGGQGELDIWYTIRTRTGEWKNPVNLGRKINTKYDEMSPFYQNKSKTLYFSSTGFPNFGGFDVFKSPGELKKWSKPLNIGYPVNSSVDDMYYRIDKNHYNGFMVSNRKGSITIKGETCCDDIYKVKWIQPLFFAVTGYVYIQGDASKTPVDGASINLSMIEMSGDISSIKTDTTGGGKRYFFNLAKNHRYRLTAAKNTYISGNATASTMNLTESDTLIRDIYIVPIVKHVGFVLRNIYYDYDQYFLRDEAAENLDTLLQLLNQNPTLVVEIGSHTDSIGTDDYNERLSQLRAESVVKYLIRNNILPERLKAKGYGESNFIAKNTNKDGTDNEEGRQLNRRTEFKIIGEINIRYITAEEDRKEGAQMSRKERRKRERARQKEQQGSDN